MMEHLVYDENGQLLSQTLMEYLLPSALDVPTIEVHHLQTLLLSPGRLQGYG
jgi:carbon-monoxide dehydrogenase large subunit